MDVAAGSKHPLFNLTISYRQLKLIAILAQVTGLLLTYVISISLSHDDLFTTFCPTPNFWPSLSKVTGNHLTERYIWRLCISIAAPLRLAEEALCYQFFSQRHQKVWYKLLNMAKLICGISEVGCLITYSFVSGKEDFGINLYSWLLFLLTSSINMALFLVLILVQPQNVPAARNGSRLRGLLLVVHVLASVLFVYCCYLHIVVHCYPNASSFAAILECVVMVTNISFHSLLLIEFWSLKITYQWNKDMKVS